MKRASAVFCAVSVLAPALALAQPAPTPASAPAAAAVPDSLVAEGIPPIPASLAEELAPYGEIRRAAFLDWHPTKREMLITTRFGETWQVHEVAMPKGDRRQLTFFKDNVRSGVHWRPNGDSFLFLKDSGGDENFQLFRFDARGSGATLLTDGRSRNTNDLHSHTGGLIAWASNRRNGNDMDLWVARADEPKSGKLLVEFQGGGFAPIDFSHDDKTILVLEEVSANESYLWTVDAATGAKTLLTPKGGAEKVSYSGGLFSNDGKSLYVTTDEGSEFQRLAHMDLATKKKTFLTSSIPWDVDELDLSDDGKTIAFVTNEDGASVLRLLDTASGKERPRPEVPLGVISGVRFHKNSKDLGFTLSAHNTSSDAYSLDVTTGALTRWTYSETGGLNAEGFAKPELIRWKSFDGKPISGFLYRPPKSFTGKRPVVIDIHGGPEGQYRPGFLGAANYSLEVLGCARIFPNVRGSSGYGKTFLKLDNGFLREDSYKDIGTLFDWIKAQPDLDADRVLVTGGSYGGFMTLAVATTYADRIRCALDVVGPSNFVTFLEHTSGYRRDLRRVEYGDERDPKMRAFLEKIAPANKTDRITKPLFVVQGKNDPRVPASESEQMVANVRKHGTPVWYLMAKDEGHGFSKKPNTNFQLYAGVLFMREYLLK
jgi:dipeptidyl aminopeptidase/acylaminoacyl peptidase